MAVTAPESGTPHKENKFLSFVLKRGLSDHGKRVMFVTSLYSRIVRFDSLRFEAIEKLNDIMELATNHHALELPTLARNFIWKGVDIQGVLNEATLTESIPDDRAKELSEKVIDLTPSWLQYSHDVMMKDLMSLIKQGPELVQAKVA